MRRAYSVGGALYQDLPEGVLDFDLVTPHVDTYKTRLDPMGAMFHSEARPWMDTHDTSTVKNVLGEMAEVVEQSPNRFRVRVRFDLQKPEAAEAHRQHKEGFVKGCSIGFDPIPGAMHVEEPESGQRCARCSGRGLLDGSDCVSCFGTGNADAVLVYDKYYVLEGSSCAAPSNPMALCVRAIEDARSVRKITQFSGEKPLDAVVSHEGWDIVEEDAFLAMFPAAATMTLEQLEGAVEAFNAQRGAKYHVLTFARKMQLRFARNHHEQHEQAQLQRSTIPAFAFTSGVFPMKPEHRGACRYMIGDHMRMAEDHLGLHGSTDNVEERKFHREAAQHSMQRAMHMARMIADSMAEGHEDAPQDAQMIGSMMRSAPEGADADLGAEWQACQRAALPYAARTWADVGKKLAKDPPELRAKFATMQAMEGAHKRMLSEQRSAAAADEAAQRQKLVLEIAASEVGLEPALEAEMLGFDAVGYERGGAKNTRSADGPWSLEAIRTHKIQIQGIAPQVTRTAPLKTTSGNATETTLQPANPDRNAQVAAPLAAFIDELAKRTGADAAKVRAVAAQNSVGVAIDNSMNAALSANKRSA